MPLVINKFCICLEKYLTVSPAMGELDFKIFWIWDLCFHLSGTCSMQKYGGLTLTFYAQMKLWQNKMNENVLARAKILLLF